MLYLKSNFKCKIKKKKNIYFFSKCEKRDDSQCPVKTKIYKRAFESDKKAEYTFFPLVH